MNTLQQGLITLIKSGLTGECLALPADFCLEETVPLIKKHHMINLVYAGAVNCGISDKDPTMQMLFPLCCKALMKSERQLQAIAALLQAFREHGIDHMLLKGGRLKALYPKPELRYMGDADILIRLDQYDKIQPIMKSLGYSFSAESDHELVWHSKALHVELHKRLIPSYNKDYYTYYGDGWERAKLVAGTSYAMSAEDAWIFLFTHFAKHYRGGGIGCRYVTDLWLYRKAHPALDECYIRQELEQLQLTEFYENILQLLQVWFLDAPTNIKMDYMTDFIFASGSWGASDSKVLSDAVRDTNHFHGRGGRIRYMWHALFPEMEVLRGKYPYLQRRPWMAPFAWLHRLFSKLFERNIFRKQQKNLSILTKENVELQKKMLEYVGLEFHF